MSQALNLHRGSTSGYTPIHLPDGIPVDLIELAPADSPPPPPPDPPGWREMKAAPARVVLELPKASACAPAAAVTADPAARRQERRVLGWGRGLGPIGMAVWS